MPRETVDFNEESRNIDQCTNSASICQQERDSQPPGSEVDELLQRFQTVNVSGLYFEADTSKTFKYHISLLFTCN